jgi:hypothetical protein
MWSRPVIVICILGALVAGFLELVLDVRVPRSALIEFHAVDAERTMDLTTTETKSAAMKAEYGPNAVTTLESQPLRWLVQVDGKVVRQDLIYTFGSVIGFIAIGARGKTASMFPFGINPQGVSLSHDITLMRLHGRAAQIKDPRVTRLLEFNDANTTKGPCAVLEPADLGPVAKLLRMDAGKFCILDWTGARRGSALIGAVLADGDPWMRPFSQRICRSLTMLALRKIAADRRQPLDYAACLLVNRPPRGADNLRIHVYEVGAAGTLALIEPPGSRGAAAEALPALE